MVKEKRPKYSLLIGGFFIFICLTANLAKNKEKVLRFNVHGQQRFTVTVKNEDPPIIPTSVCKKKVHNFQIEIEKKSKKWLTFLKKIKKDGEWIAIKSNIITVARGESVTALFNADGEEIKQGINIGRIEFKCLDCKGPHKLPEPVKVIATLEKIQARLEPEKKPSPEEKVHTLTPIAAITIPALERKVEDYSKQIKESGERWNQLLKELPSESREYNAMKGEFEQYKQDRKSYQELIQNQLNESTKNLEKVKDKAAPLKKRAEDYKKRKNYYKNLKGKKDALKKARLTERRRAKYEQGYETLLKDVTEKLAPKLEELERLKANNKKLSDELKEVDKSIGVRGKKVKDAETALKKKQDELIQVKAKYYGLKTEYEHDIRTLASMKRAANEAKRRKIAKKAAEEAVKRKKERMIYILRIIRERQLHLRVNRTPEIKGVYDWLQKVTPGELEDSISTAIPYFMEDMVSAPIPVDMVKLGGIYSILYNLRNPKSAGGGLVLWNWLKKNKDPSPDNTIYWIVKVLERMKEVLDKR